VSANEIVTTTIKWLHIPPYISWDWFMLTDERRAVTVGRAAEDGWLLPQNEMNV